MNRWRRLSRAFTSGALTAVLLAVPAAAGAEDASGADPAPQAKPDPAMPDVAAGSEVFRRQCLACHTAEPGQHKTGPSLAGVAGRKAGSTDFPRYRGLIGADFDWTAEALDAYLADPRAFVTARTGNERTSMTFRVADAQQRRDVVAYLQTLK